ncbi:hypothetical protein [Hyalangium sp.]|uniref:hypothetical protein n=1 Tax=Hyalangium sp. TaxID=2028555 RepID=UPI002D4DCE8A|nr:hypothetical protein [Hyalangium sp.]HYI00702.1 hypothetical protein [Hyalangium sp.]
MKKLIAALALCVGTAAFAEDINQNDKLQKDQQAQQEKKRDASQVFTQKPGDSIRESQRKAEEGVDATQVGPKIGKAAKDVTGIQTESEGTFKTAQAFSMRGTLKDKTAEGVTIERPGLPAADLDIRDKTAVWLDGKKVKKDALPEGAQVRAKFQLEGQDIVAVELRATTPKGTKTPAAKPMKDDTLLNDGTGGSGTLRDDASELEGDVKSGAKDMKDEVKDETHEMRDDVNKSLR